MPFDDFITVKKSRSQAEIEPTTFGNQLTALTNWATEALVGGVDHVANDLFVFQSSHTDHSNNFKGGTYLYRNRSWRRLMNISSFCPWTGLGKVWGERQNWLLALVDPLVKYSDLPYMEDMNNTWPCRREIVAELDLVNLWFWERVAKLKDDLL